MSEMSFKEKDPMPAGHMRLPAAVSMVIERFSKTVKNNVLQTLTTHMEIKSTKTRKGDTGMCWVQHGSHMTHEVVEGCLDVGGKKPKMPL